MPTLGPRSQIYLKRTVEDLQPVVRTTLSYPIEATDTLGVSQAICVSGFLKKINSETASLEEIGLSAPLLLSGDLRAVVRTYELPGGDALIVGVPQVMSGGFRTLVRTGDDTLDSLAVSVPSLVEGTFHGYPLITHTAYDIESIQTNTLTIIGGSLARV